ncbi:MAG TPA: PilC/PilY family type IV pilus protein, partial [Rhodanobacter sp.]|nr:PilC/PilY family type IV pilus protein [Rhodanobacter sp.]
KNISTLPDSKGGFWVNAISQQGGNDGYDAPDGQIVEKGGVGQQIRLKSLTDTYTGTTPTTSRNLYTCIGSCASGTALNTMPFNTGNTNLTTTALQIPTGSPITSANLPNFINWVRGEDTHAQVPDSVAGPESSAPPDSSITIRGSVHGDVLHSRPAVINYGGSIGVVAFYGSNDGVFRAVNGNNPVNGNQPGAITMTGSGSSVPAGGELWGFVPPELYPGLQQLYQNSPALHLGNAQTSPPSASTSGKNYFFDGDTGVYHNTTTGTTYIFLSARRGGRLLYALDVTDPTNPKFLWKHTNTDPGFAELGQTWSQPKVAMVKGYANPVLIFGAGYDPNEDAEPPNADTMGRGIFVLDAVTGNLLWQAVSPLATCAGGSVACVKPTGMNYAIPADITLIDSNGDGLIDRLYAADLGGNIWRVDLQPDGTGALSTWQVTQFAALGGTGTTKRKFFFPPDVVLTNSIDLVSDVTGDREHPLSTQQANNIVNRFYMIQDTKVGMSARGWSTVTDNSSSTANAAPTATLPLLSDATSTTYLGSLPGYYVTLLNPGEKGVNAPLTVAGTVYFGTSQPPQSSSTSCTANLGTARSYQLSLLSGTKSISVFAGGGLAPSPVFAVVDVVVNGKTQQMPVLFGGGVGTGSDKSSSVGANNPFASISMPKKRTYWYRNIDH